MHSADTMSVRYLISISITVLTQPSYWLRRQCTSFLHYHCWLVSLIEVCVSASTRVDGKAWSTTALCAASDDISDWFENWIASMAIFSDSVTASKCAKSRFSGIPMPECRTNCSDMFKHSSVKSVMLLDGRFMDFNWAKNFKFRKMLACMVRSCDIDSSICLFDSSRSLFFCTKLAFHRANSSTIKLKMEE